MMAYEVSNAVFNKFSTSSNGGVFNINKDIPFSACFCYFSSCTVGTCDGGCIYFSSSKTLITSNNCIFSCIASNGQFLYSIGPSTYANLELNNTVSQDCSGTGRAVCYLKNTNILSRKYNSSFCSSGVHCNVGVHECARSNSSYYQFYRNPNDILYNVNAGGSDHVFSFALFVNNTLRAGECGYIHFNSPVTASITTNYIYAFSNSHKIFNQYKGTIIVNNFFGDEFSSTGTGTIKTSNIKEDKNFVYTTFFAKKLICNEKSIKCISLVPRRRSSFNMLALVIVIML